MFLIFVFHVSTQCVVALEHNFNVNILLGYDYAGQETPTTDEWNSSQVWGSLDLKPDMTCIQCL
jgi:hypothetical protein